MERGKTLMGVPGGLPAPTAVNEQEQPKEGSESPGLPEPWGEPLSAQERTLPPGFRHLPKPAVQLIPGPICGVQLSPNIHSRLKNRARVNKRPLKLEVLADVCAAETARTVLLSALNYHKFSGHSMPKSQIRDALAALGIPHDEQP